MRCPFCDSPNTKVCDSRPGEGGASIRRRRECEDCEKRFTTFERIEKTRRLVVVKRDETRVPFDGERILRGVQAACGKRPIPEDAKIALVQKIEDDLHREFDREIPSEEIGRRVTTALRELDHIAYIRYASEYEQFRNVEDIAEAVDKLRQRPPTLPNQEPLFGEE
ncbi:transcriptional regulator NrdR [Phycisphaerales bacterium]|nr:transcriptional regulator NrdR [Phycisphaerales bacterium]RPG20155.1 MAG: transcriptional repressor NrdR [Phycisphaera sp. TMED9]